MGVVYAKKRGEDDFKNYDFFVLNRDFQKFSPQPAPSKIDLDQSKWTRLVKLILNIDYIYLLINKLLKMIKIRFYLQCICTLKDPQDFSLTASLNPSGENFKNFGPKNTTPTL